jgi:hypothetical protein
LSQELKLDRQARVEKEKDKKELTTESTKKKRRQR